MQGRGCIVFLKLQWLWYTLQALGTINQPKLITMVSQSAFWAIHHIYYELHWLLQMPMTLWKVRWTDHDSLLMTCLLLGRWAAQKQSGSLSTFHWNKKKKNSDLLMKWTSSRPLHLPGIKFLIHSKNSNWNGGNTGKSTMLCLQYLCMLHMYKLLISPHRMFHVLLAGCSTNTHKPKHDDSCQTKFNIAHKQQLLFMLVGIVKNVLTN